MPSLLKGLFMKSRKHLFYALGLLSSCLMLVDCGQSGPLYLPKKQPEQKVVQKVPQENAETAKPTETNTAN